MSRPDCSRVIRLDEAQGSIPGPAGEHAVVVFRRGPLDVVFSLPLRPSQQTPHLQDEIYFIVRGQGVLIQWQAGSVRVRRPSVRGCGNRAPNRGDFREFCDVARILRPPWWRGASVERVAVDSAV